MTNPKRQNSMTQLVFIKPAAKRAHIRLQDLAEQVGVSREAIRKISTGKAFPKPQTLEAIARVLQVPVWHLFVNPTEGVPVMDTEGLLRCPYCGNPIRVYIGEHPRAKVMTHEEREKALAEIRAARSRQARP